MLFGHDFYSKGIDGFGRPFENVFGSDRACLPKTTTNLPCFKEVPQLREKTTLYKECWS